jgi:hypothetical protein
MSIIIKSGSSGNLANVDASGNLAVAVSTAIPAGDNIVGQMKITDGANVLGTITNPLVTSQAPPQDLIVTGTIASSPVANVEINTQGGGIALINITGSWSGTLVFEATGDGVNWNTAIAFPKPSTTAAINSTTANGVWAFPCGGANKFRVRASAWSTGIASIHLEVTQSTQLVQVYNLYDRNMKTYSTCIGTLDDNVPVAVDDTQNMGVLPAHVTALPESHTHDTLSFLHLDLQGNLRIRQRSESVLGDVVVIPRLNQIEINFSEGFDAGLITNSASGSGSFQAIDGVGEWFTGTAITGQATGTTTQTLKYHPGHEWYCKFTAGFTTPTDSFNPNHQRIGPFNATDGFWIGYEKTTFCLTQFQNGTPTSIPKSSWNGDPVDGSVNSTFTRLGVPEVLNFNNINIYRLRGSWFGTAPVQLQVYTPDLDWVTLHTFHFPNTVLLPYAFTTDWNIQVDVLKSGSDSTNLKIQSPCVALGTNNDTSAINDVLTDYSQAKLVRAVLTGRNRISGNYDNVGLSTENAITVAGSGIATLDVAVWDSTTPQDTFVMPLHNDYHHNTVTISLVSTSPISAGAITFEASIDNIHFIGLLGVDNGTGQQMASPVVTISAGSTKIFTFNVTGFDHFRYRLSTPITGAGTVTSSHLVQGLATPSISTTITTGTVNVDSTQGAPNTLNNAWPMEITDGTHGPAAVKAASTPAGAADPALVVAISPNNAVAVTGTFFPATQPVSGSVAVTQTTSPWVTQDNHFTHNLNQDGSGNVGVNVQNFPVNQTVSGGVTAQILDSGGANKASVDAAGHLQVDLPESQFTAGTTSAPTTIVLVGGKSADGTPVYNPIPLAAGSGSVVISGSVRAQDGAGNALTSNSTATAGKFGLDTNILSILGTAPTTAGFIDIKGADGNVFVRQATASNLNATVVGTLTNNNAAPAATNVGALTVLANASAPSFTEGDQVLLSSDLAGNLRTRTRPAAPLTGLWLHAIITVAAATGTQTLVAAVGGQTIRVMKVQFTTDKSTNFNFLDSTPTNLSGVYVLTGNGSSFADSGDGEPLWIGASGKAFQISLTATVTLGGDIWYTQS